MGSPSAYFSAGSGSPVSPGSHCLVGTSRPAAGACLAHGTPARPPGPRTHRCSAAPETRTHPSGLGSHSHTTCSRDRAASTGCTPAHEPLRRSGGHCIPGDGEGGPGPHCSTHAPSPVALSVAMTCLYLHEDVLHLGVESWGTGQEGKAMPRVHQRPGPSVHGILQARILEWVSMLLSGGPPRPKG